MKKIISLFIYLSLLLVFSCQQNQKEISKVATKKFIKEYEQNNTAILIDVRTPEEYLGGYIDGALNFDIYSKSFKDDISYIDTTKTIFLYCRSGKRSNSAAHILKDMGFKKIYDLKGGYLAYKEEFK
jgi:phage shock protein E